MNPVRAVWHQHRYDRLTFWRDPASVFFTVVLPLIFLFLFVSIFGNGTVNVDGQEVRGATYFVPGILALAIVSATVVNLAITCSILRERGILKRLRATPMPSWVFTGGKALTATAVVVGMTALVAVVGRLVYDVELPTTTLPGLLLTLAVATPSLCALGLALTAAIPTEQAAPAVTNAIVLPLYFVSGVFVPDDQLPSAMRTLAEVFPVKHLFEALVAAFDPTTTGPGIQWGNLAVLAAWGVVGAAVASRTFRWTPVRG